MASEQHYVSTSELCKRYGRSPRTLHRWQRTYNFPKPIIPGGHGAQARWRQNDITEWENQRLQD
ncbi:MAG: helix-turn-helix transcriptional regulator [Saccharospirillum sp.]